MKSQTGKQTLTINALPDISKSKGNWTTEFSQLMDYNARNIFLQKSCRIWDRETNSRPIFVF